MEKSDKIRRPRDSWREKRPVAAFVLLFGCSFLVLHLVVSTDGFERRVWRPYLSWNARAAGAILRICGQENEVSSRVIRGTGASIVVERGCDGIYPSILLGSAVLASHFRFRWKLIGLLIGSLTLSIVNLFRIASLFYIQERAPRWFETVHQDVWQFLFVLLAMAIWLAWAHIELRREAARPRRSADANAIRKPATSTPRSGAGPS